MKHHLHLPALWLACLVQFSIEDKEIDLVQAERLWGVLHHPRWARDSYYIPGVATWYKRIRRELESTT